tara:strand:+ start:22492 stop:23442 length:951 start_codon:yes stop_codon:yes gene_type:complete
MKFQLETEDNNRINSICGPTNTILKKIEKDLEVKIVNRGTSFKIEGEESLQKLAKDIILKLFRDSASNSQLTPEDVHPYITNGLHNIDLNGNISYQSDMSIRTPKEQVSINKGTQQQYVKTIEEKDLTFGIGPAGTGKTYLAVAKAVQKFSSGEIERILLVRPAVEAGEKLGFLPGDLSQKIDPYLRPLYDALFRTLGFKETHQLIERNVIEVVPLAFMRGRTLNNSFIILDESQNATIEQMKMFLTRFGFGSKVVVTGDLTQIDLPKDSSSGLVHSLDVLRDLDDIGFVEFKSRDIVRHGLVKKIVEAYSDYDPD